MRSSHVDTVRGLLMLYIVFIVHGVFWLHLLPAGVGGLLLFEMPLVFIVSGYAYALYENAKGSAAASMRTYLAFVAGRFLRVLLPYYAYAAACLAFMYFAPPPAGQPAPARLVAAWANPLVYGGADAYGVLNWHLWFIPIFLAINLVLPLAARIRVRALPLGCWAMLFLAAMTLLSFAGFRGQRVLKPVAFYLVFAMLGYWLQKNARYFRSADYLPIAAVALGTLLLVPVTGTVQLLGMQTNKFPPNFLFYLFNCGWLSLFLVLLTRRRAGVERLLARAQRTWLLQPFIKAGYSIYLWQGMGYTLAWQAGTALRLPRPAIWLAALSLSTMLGMLASPLERIKLKRPGWTGRHPA